MMRTQSDDDDAVRVIAWRRMRRRSLIFVFFSPSPSPSRRRPSVSVASPTPSLFDSVTSSFPHTFS